MSDKMSNLRHMKLYALSHFDFIFDLESEKMSLGLVVTAALANPRMHIDKKRLFFTSMLRNKYIFFNPLHLTRSLNARISKHKLR